MRRPMILFFTCAVAILLLSAFGLAAQAATGQRQRIVTSQFTAAAIGPPLTGQWTEMSVFPSQENLVIGEMLFVTVSMDMPEECTFANSILHLGQVGNVGQIFEYVSPPTHTVWPPVDYPFTYMLTPTRTGEVAFHGGATGELWCCSPEACTGSWTGFEAESDPVTVWPQQTSLPFVHKE